VPVSHFAGIVALKRATSLTRNVVDRKGGAVQLNCEDRVMRSLRRIYCNSESSIVVRPAFSYIYRVARDVSVETPQTDVA
jgi:hypothetical protein